VGLSGSAEMGLVGGNGTETQFHQVIEVNFNGSGETDGGVSFGMSVQLDEGGASGPADDQGASINVSGGFGNLTMGDTDGAMDWALTEGGNVGNGGSIADNETDHGGYLGSYLDGNEDGQILRYDNTVGSFGIAASLELDDNGSRNVASAAGTFRNAFTAAGVGTAAAAAPGGSTTTGDFTDGGDTSMALGVKYTMDMGGDSLTVGAGYQSAADRVVYIATATDDANDDMLTETMGSADTTATGFSATYAMASGLSFGIAMTEYSDYAGINAADGAAVAATTGALTDASHTAIGVGFASGQLTVHANYGELDYDSAAIDDVDGYGVSVGYDLGGASVLLGMNNNDAGADWSLGLSMSF
jgi:outer membrane protein OmpU